MAGLYIHIPFCARRCVYCGFYSTTLRHMRHDYVGAVTHELELRSHYLQGAHVHTIYIGGGTPTQLDLSDLSFLLGALRQTAPHAAEVTVECNPDDVTPTLSAALLQMGVNRVSLGIQTFNDSLLTFLHRRHDARQARQAVSELKEAGFQNISIDLMFGFPGQTIAQMDADLDAALRLEVPHLSAYSLMYEEGTPLYRQLQEGQIREADEETVRAMYDRLCQRLISSGYEHYEISNFALEGFRSRHNSSYWDGTPYLGLGAGAHSYDGASRQWNVSDVEAYISAIHRDELPFERETLSPATRVNDRITTALRTREGLDLDDVAKNEGASYVRLIRKSALPHLRRGLLREDGNRLILTHEGIHLSDLIMSDLMII